jgi:hypothetical protein
MKIQGPDEECDPTEKNVILRFGNEFPFLRTGSGCDGGFYAENLIVLAQKVVGDIKPNPNNWKKIDITDQIDPSTISSGFLTLGSLTGTTFVIDNERYTNGTLYNLDDYISLPDLGQNNNCLNFGDEYYFYGNIETDIEATIFQMKYIVNLTMDQFKISSNPTWTSGSTIYVSEIGLFDEDKDLVVVSKLQSPQLRQGIQQFAVSYIF